MIYLKKIVFPTMIGVINLAFSTFAFAQTVSVNLSHNGNAGTLSPSANVAFGATGEMLPGFSRSDAIAFNADKSFLPGSETSTHRTRIVGPPDEFMNFSEVVTNNTGISWSEYHIDVSYGAGSGLPNFTNPSLDRGAALTELVDPNTGTHSLWFVFDNPVNDGESLEFSSQIQFLPARNFVEISQAPSIVPEPSAIAISVPLLLACVLFGGRNYRSN